MIPAADPCAVATAVGKSPKKGLPLPQVPISAGGQASTTQITLQTNCGLNY